MILKLCYFPPRDFFFVRFSLSGQPQRMNPSTAIPVCRTVVPKLTPVLFSWTQFLLNVNKMVALSKGTFLIPEAGTHARHLYICFQMNWFLCCKYLTILHSIPPKVSIRFSTHSISYGQIKLLLLSRTPCKQSEIIFHGVWFEKEQKVGSERHSFPLVEARRPWGTKAASEE